METVPTSQQLQHWLCRDTTPSWSALSQEREAAPAAKSLQSCLTPCGPTDSSPPGSSVPGILKARTLECVAMSFSNACMHAKSPQLCPTLRPHGQQPTRFLHPRDSPGKNTGVGCHFLLQGKGRCTWNIDNLSFPHIFSLDRANCDSPSLGVMMSKHLIFSLDCYHFCTSQEWGRVGFWCSFHS